jgi:endonuclease/exonuclease/phosphatase family metal-dependent hydrolase
VRPDPGLLARDAAIARDDARTTVEPLGLRVGRPGSVSALVAAVVVVAIELVRAYPALVAWHPGARQVGGAVWSAVYLAPFAGAAALLVAMAFGRTRPLLLVASAAVGVGRIAAQVTDGDLRLAAAAVALAAALALLGLLVTLGLPMFGTGLLAGVAVDLALQVVLGTRSLLWVEGPGPLVVVVLLVAWLVALAGHRVRREVFVLGRSVRSALPLAAIGMVLVAEAHHLAALGWVATALDGGWLAAAAVVLTGAAAGSGAAVLAARFPDAHWTPAVAAGAAAVLAATVAPEVPGWWWAPVLVLAQVAAAVGVTRAVARGVGTGPVSGPLVVLGVGVGLVAAGLAVVDGRGVFGLALPPSSVLVGLAGLLVVGALVSRRELSTRPHRPGRLELLSLVGVLLAPALALVLCGWLVGTGTRAAAATGDGVRVVTYNVALAFGADGRPNLTDVRDALVELTPDVVSLQEVPRGQLPAGGVDMVGWLQRELDMPYAAFQAAVPGALHGNAVLSRFPIVGVDELRFDRTGTALSRGALAVLVDVPGAEPLRIVGAHLPPGGAPTQQQRRVESLLRLWSGRPRTVVAADLNVEPGSRVVARLAESGLRSAWDPADGPGFTYPAREPVARIDWILHTDDLEVLEAVVHPSVASDHRPLLAVVR